MKQIKFLLLPVILIFNFYILFFQTEWLGISLFENPPFPLGTLISWVSMAILPLIVFQILTLKNRHDFERRTLILLKVIISLGIAWGIVSWILSGNWTFNFANKKYFIIWILYSAFIIFSSIAILIFSTLRKLFFKK